MVVSLRSESFNGPKISMLQEYEAGSNVSDPLLTFKLKFTNILYLNCRGLLVGGLGTVVTVILAIITGLTMYTVYEGCDPLSSGKVEKSDQV